MAVGAGVAVATAQAMGCAAFEASRADTEVSATIASTACDELLLRQAFAMLASTCGDSDALRSGLLQWCDAWTLGDRTHFCWERVLIVPVDQPEFVFFS